MRCFVYFCKWRKDVDSKWGKGWNHRLTQQGAQRTALSWPHGHRNCGPLQCPDSLPPPLVPAPLCVCVSSWGDSYSHLHLQGSHFYSLVVRIKSLSYVQTGKYCRVFQLLGPFASFWTACVCTRVRAMRFTTKLACVTQWPCLSIAKTEC